MKVLIVEDDPLHRSFLKDIVISALPECETVIEAEDGLQGEALHREHRPENVVMDLQMHHRNGIEAARTIWQERPQTNILFWSNYSDEAYVRGVGRIVPPGAAYGYVLKSASEERLKVALKGVFIENQCVVDREVHGLQHRGATSGNGLSDSEYEVLMDVALGLTDRAIAKRRNLSPRTVQNRLQQIFDKLDVCGEQRSGSEHAVHFNTRARVGVVALRMKLINHNALELAEAELQRWLKEDQ
ncbi:response regulator transcription factor [Maritalea myrionectae]|uniref:response regulator transcription factor n=1 Tax=Maritalea myrionectae TaxID=454601 RepID=UPI0004053E05|nr:response regulator transcription factor [Maritalea myrionectae]